MPEDGWLVRGLAEGADDRVLAVEVTGAAREVVRAHRLGPRAARVAAEGVVAAALLSAHVKGEERLTLQLQAEDPKIAFIGDVDAQGHLRARFPPEELPVGFDGRLSGMMLTIKHNATKELYRGVTEVRREPITHALQRHLSLSSQVPGVVRSVVQMGVSGEVNLAGGVYVERLPSAASPEKPPVMLDNDAVVEVLRSLPEVGAIAGLPILVLHQRPILWRCRCSLERVKSMLRGLGPDELFEMHAADGRATITCDFCRQVYRVEGDELAKLAEP